ncbi:MAG: YdeI/OmpD-associated family protein [Flavobacteriales bacterium]|nr:YdeI/OmpD-associated family protein [Flavobacteriales bacterium]MCL4281359.1 YdeI/OmpD-associated family protein [Flavobacteriales bacterium]
MLPSEQINLYIAEQPEWQRKLMVRLRQLIHSACPEVEEAWRAQAPHFDLASQPLLTITAGKTCISVQFPKGAQFKSTRQPYEPCAEDKPGRTVKFHEGSAIHEAGFSSLVTKAAALNQKLAKAGSEGKDPLHTELEAVLRKDPSAWANWGSFSPSCRREYEEWVNDGRSEETRKRRIAQALEMIRTGFTRQEEEHRVKGA